MSPRRIILTATIAGRVVNVRSVRTDHGTDRPIGTCALTVSAPRLSFMQPGAVVRVYAGYDNGTWPIFWGRIADDDSIFDDGGGEVRIECEGWARLLYYRMYQDLGYSGPIGLDAFFRGLCHWRNVPNYLADGTSAPDGMSNIMLGSNPDVEGGWVPLERNTSPGAEIDRYARLYGYRMFDTPRGTVRLKRISGLPDEFVEGVTPVFATGQNVLSIERTRTMDGVVNYWEALGAKYQAADTSEVAIRSIPSTVPFDERLGPDGVAHQQIRDESMVTETLARAARNAHEIDRSDAAEIWRWRTTGQPERQPGEAVAVMAPDVVGWDGEGTVADLIRYIPRAVWLTRVVHTITDAGWTTDMEGWAGLGSQLPAGNDCVTQTLLGNGGVHIGNEYLWHYRNPSPIGTSYDIPFSVVDGYSTATVRARAHGVNNFIGNTESEASRFEIWHSSDTDRPSMSGVMPLVDENLEQRLPYSDDQYWSDIVVPLSGSLKAGSNTFRIVAGEDRTVGDIDDYEVKSITLTTCGIGSPDVEGGT